MDLGYVLNEVEGADFSMQGFSDRLRLQKVVYMIQAFGIYLGYDFSWYMRGPYCTRLARHGFDLEQIYDRIPRAETRFDKPDKQKAFERAKKFIARLSRMDLGGLSFTDKVEIAASLHLLLSDRGMSRGDAVEKVSCKQTRFSAGHCEKIYEAVRSEGLLQ